MATLPVVCEHCGTLFPFQGIGGTGGLFYLEGNRVNCPACGRMALIPDGTYELLNDSFRVLSGTGSGKTQQLISLLEEWQRNPPASADVAVKELREVAPPELGQRLERLLAGRSSVALAAWISVILTLLMYLQGCEERDEPVNIDHGVKVTIERVVEQQRSAGRPDQRQHHRKP